MVEPPDASHTVGVRQKKVEVFVPGDPRFEFRKNVLGFEDTPFLREGLEGFVEIFFSALASKQTKRPHLSNILQFF